MTVWQTTILRQVWSQIKSITIVYHHHHQTHLHPQLANQLKSLMRNNVTFPNENILQRRVTCPQTTADESSQHFALATHMERREHHIAFHTFQQAFKWLVKKDPYNGLNLYVYMYVYVYIIIIKLPIKLRTPSSSVKWWKIMYQKDFPVLQFLIIRFTVLDFSFQFQVDHTTHFLVWQVRTKSCPRTQDLEKHPSVENRLHAWWEAS